MAHSRHDAPLGDHGDGTEPVLLGPHHGCDGEIPSGANSAVHAKGDAIA